MLWANDPLRPEAVSENGLRNDGLETSGPMRFIQDLTHRSPKFDTAGELLNKEQIAS
jgi:hypothetical protein